jgi:hypothetical protein
MKAPKRNPGAGDAGEPRTALANAFLEALRRWAVRHVNEKTTIAIPSGFVTSSELTQVVLALIAVQKRTRPRGESAAGFFDSSAVTSRRADENSESRHGGSVTTADRTKTAVVLSTFPVAASKGGPHGYEQIFTTKP